MAEKSRTAPLNVLETFGQLIDQELGEKCINIILVNSLNDSGGTGDESGFATIGGRNIFLEEGELNKGTGAVLAHELGHNLGLEHVKIDGRLMNEGNAGTTLIKKECDDACKMATNEALKPASLSDDEAKDRYDALEEAHEKAEEEREAKEEEERKKKEEEEKRQKEIDEIDKRIGEIDGRTAELEETIKEKEDSFRKSIEKQGFNERQKKQILDDNLPIQARKEKAELEKLKKEKAGLEVKKTGMQR